MTDTHRALLIYPAAPQNTYWSFHYSMSFIGKKNAMPPLGLVTVAAMFPDSWELKLLDLNIEKLTEEDIKWADAVFISSMIVQQDSFRTVVELCNRLNTTVVAGGPYATACYQEIDGVDHFVLGEVENSFGDFISDLENGVAKAIYQPPDRPDITHTRTPRFDLLNLKAYSSMAVQYSRGCPFRCEFCDIWAAYGNKPRLKSPDSVLKEFDLLYQLGWRGALFIVDDNFISNKQRVKKELLPPLQLWQDSRNYAFRLFTEASINLADDPQLMEAMRKAGFNEVFVGIESPSEESLRETGKTQNLRMDMGTAVQKIQSHGMEVMGGFIIGFDNDTESIADAQIDFVQKNGIPQAMIGLLSALPGTELQKRLQSEGRMLSTALGNNTHAMTTNFVTKMNPESLKRIYQKVLSTIYDRNLKNYFDRCSMLLDRIGHRPLFQREVHFDELKMLFRSLFRQPFTPYGFQYLKFVIRNAFKNWFTFGEAIKYAIVGHHFHTITQEMLKTEKVALDLERCYRYLKEQLNKQSQLVVENYRDAAKNIVNLLNHKTRILSEIKGRIERIHIDFRNEAVLKYQDFELKIREMFEKINQDIAEIGVGG